MLKYAHHVHYVVSNLEEMIAYMEQTFGMKPDPVDEYMVRGAGLKKALYTIDRTQLDIMEPTNSKSNAAKFLKEKGPCVMHIGWGVDNIEQAADDLTAKGTKFSGQGAITQSVRGYQELNIDPESSHGIWFQLCE